MKVYADSSFILRLVVGETGSEEAIAAYRQAGRPMLPYLWIHQLEVENALRQRAFHETQVRPAKERPLIQREVAASFARLGQLQRRRGLTSVTIDWEAVVARSLKLSADHTQRIGARAIDILHVSAALQLGVDQFLTFDRRQATMGRQEGLQVVDLTAEFP
ncbi:MAG: PIN domain-containing protein [Verrucomicrobiales bacterium]|nr:PIN domain-containing protein [Verrucomicrobiales bacterium]